jgi:hypothetical protein
MLKKLVLSAIMIGSVMMFSQNVFALGSASVNGSYHPATVDCVTGDVFAYNSNTATKKNKNEKSLLLAVDVDLSAVGSKRFNVVLDGAIWSEDMTSGVLDCNYATTSGDDDDLITSDGVTYRRLNDTTLAVSIDRKKVSDTLKFFVPLNCIITGTGDITVALDGVTYNPSRDKVVFATAGEAPTTETTTKVEISTSAFGNKILSSVTTEATTSNKAIKETTTEATTETTTEAVTEETTEVATEESTEATTEVATETTTVASVDTASQAYFDITTGTRVVSFTAGADNYYINNAAIPTDVRAYVSADGYTMLPLRAFANALDIDNVSYNSATKTAVFTLYGGHELSITAGESSFVLDGQRVEITGKAEVKDGRMFLPLRGMAYAFGIADDYIEYDADTKTATIFVG